MSIFSKQKPKGQIEEHRKAEIAKGYKLISSKHIYKNHILFEYNTQNGELKPADIEIKSTYVDGNIVSRKKVIVKPLCKYFSSLNRDNAIKKLGKNGYFVSNL